VIRMPSVFRLPRPSTSWSFLPAGGLMCVNPPLRACRLTPSHPTSLGGNVFFFQRVQVTALEKATLAFRFRSSVIRLRSIRFCFFLLFFPQPFESRLPQRTATRTTVILWALSPLFQGRLFLFHVFAPLSLVFEDTLFDFFLNAAHHPPPALLCLFPWPPAKRDLSPLFCSSPRFPPAPLRPPSL